MSRHMARRSHRDTTTPAVIDVERKIPKETPHELTAGPVAVCPPDPIGHLTNFRLLNHKKKYILIFTRKKYYTATIFFETNLKRHHANNLEGVAPELDKFGIGPSL